MTVTGRAFRRGRPHDPMIADEGLSFDAGFILKGRQVVLTDAQIQALPTTRVVIVPNPGVGKILIAIRAIYRLDWVADYANIDPSCFIRLSSTSGIVSYANLQESTGEVTRLLANGESMTSIVDQDNGTGLYTFDDNEIGNEDFTLRAFNGAAGVFTDGDPDNTLTVTVFYLEHTL